jgi:ABC-type enterochelin transport system substrate-binding protein
MAFIQRESAELTAATERMNGLKAIDPTAQLDLGNGHTMASYEAQIETVKTNLDSYNKARKTLDALKNTLDASEKVLAKKSSAMLTGVGQKFTKDSSEYEQAGGVRESERKKPVRKATGL